MPENVEKNDDIYRLIFENAGEAIFLADDSFRYVDANPAACALFGYSREEILGKSVYAHVHPDDRNDRGDNPAIVRSGKALNTKMRMVRKDGSVFHAEVLIKKIKEGLYHSIIRDVSAHSAAEEELKKNYTLLRTTIDALPLWIACASPGGDYFIANKYYTDTFRLPLNMIEGHNYREFFPPALVNAHRPLLERCIETGRIVSWEEIAYFEENKPSFLYGSYTPLFDGSGKCWGISVVALDVTEKKEMEIRLEQTADQLGEWMRRYELIVAASGQVAYDYDVATKKIIWGRTSEKVLGLTPEELGGGFDQWRDLLHADDREKTLGSLSEAEKNCSFWDCEYRLRHRDGHYVWIRDRGFFVAGPDGRAGRQLGMMEDVTQKKLAEKAVLESEEKFRRIFEEGPLGMAMVSPNFRFLGANDAFCMITGYSKGELAAMTFRDITHPDYIARDIDAISKLVKGEIPVYKAEKKYVRKDREAVWASVTVTAIKDYTGRLTYLLAMVENINERKTAEEKLRISEEKFSKAFYTSPDAIAINRFSDGVYIECNQGFTDITGYTREEVFGRSSLPGDLGIWVNNEDRNKLISALMRHGECKGLEAPFRCKNGTIVTGLMSAKIIEIDREKCILTITRDITELKKIQQAIIQARDAAEAASHAKSDFMANMSHELRTPLNGIIGFANLLDGSGLNAKQKDFIHTVKTSSGHLLELINDILDFSKLDANKIKLENIPFDIASDVVNSIKLLSEQAAQKKLRLEYEIDPAINYTVIGDPLRFRQVIFNLLTNAIKFTAEGRIDVKISESSRSDENAILSVSVSDTGIGIPNDRIGEIFEMFHQLDESNSKRHGGAGLGLSIVRGLVGLMGGTIGVESEPGKGSRFTVEIPFKILSETPKATCENKAETQSAAGENSLEILLAEDDQISKALIKAITRNFGWKISFADTGKEAVDLYISKRFDAIFMDGQMPVMDGFEATRKIRDIEKETGRHVPIIALTAYAMDGDAGKFLSAGMDDYISKPIDDDNILVEKVKSLCKRFSNENK